MNKIKILPESVFSKIAAGEVIERPASVVRELIDNSLDAEAKEIIINVENGGIKKIIVIDDGYGIEKSDLKYALSKHATSKISNVSDLLNLKTMGFRGEALYSIQTVSKISVVSNTDSTGKSPGYKTANYGENKNKIISVASKKGTKVEVEDVFYNIPVRKKFLKSTISEWNNIKKVVSDKAFSFLDKSFKLYNNNIPVFYTNGNLSFENTFFSIYKNEPSFPIYNYCKKISDDLIIEIYFSSHDVFFHNRKFQKLFVNKRVVMTNFFYPAVDSGIRNYISPGRYPLIFLYIDINPALIDINIHPAKKEIKFIDQNKIFTDIQQTVSEGISSIINKDIYKPININKEYSTYEDSSELKFYQKNDTGKKFHNYFTEVIEKEDSIIKNEAIKKRQSSDYNIIGIVFDTYIVIEKSMKIIFIDFHAACESIIFNKKKEKYNKEKNIERLIIPIVFDIDETNDNVEDKIELLNNSNFLIERGEGSTLIIRELPSILLNNKNYDYITELIKNFFENEFNLKKRENLIDMFLIEASCKEAVKKGDKITLLEMVEIVEEFFKLGVLNCPHGRPIYFELSKEFFEKQFQRRK